MTVGSEKKRAKKRVEKHTKMSRGQILFCIMGTACLLLTFIYSESAIEAMSVGMRLCVNTVIPSLFPFMAVSEIFVASGGASLFGRLLSPFLGRVFGISGEGCVSYLLGMLCGFPVGIRSAISLYEKGAIGKRELEHLSVFCNGPSSAFLISAVGTSLLGDRRLGVMLYVSHIITGAIVGFASRFYFSAFRSENSAGCSDLFCRVDERKNVGIAESIVSAITKSALGMLYICAFILFFSSLSPLLTSFCDFFCLSPLPRALLLGIFEMTGGTVAAASLARPFSYFSVAAITFWSGLSVFCQFVGLVGEHKISLVPYFVAKLVGSVLCGAVFCVICSAFSLLF